MKALNNKMQAIFIICVWVYHMGVDHSYHTLCIIMYMHEQLYYMHMVHAYIPYMPTFLCTSNGLI